MAFDLMERGRSIHDLGTIGLSWMELEALIDHAPPTTALRMLKDPLSGFRTPELQVLSTAVDTLSGANWQRGGGRGPRPIPLMTRIQQEIDKAKVDASAPTSVEQMNQVRSELAARRKRAVDSPEEGRAAPQPT